MEDRIDLPQNTGSEVQTFIENTLNQVKKGTENSGFKIAETVDFDLEVTERKEKGVGVGFKQFIKIGGKKEGETSQRVRFSVKPKVKIGIY
ncbi:MAG: hypothetical protein KKB31_05005 [Nanoarchaeota archaeon]|nr:hypothetical protein [Nanoarchaeota archaeon]